MSFEEIIKEAERIKKEEEKKWIQIYPKEIVKRQVIYMNEIFEEIKRITDSFIEDGERFIEERKAMKDDNI